MGVFGVRGGFGPETWGGSMGGGEEEEEGEGKKSVAKLILRQRCVND